MRKLVFWGATTAALAMLLLFATQGLGGSALRQPSAQNRMPWGLRAAFVFLEERGFDVRTFRRPVSEIPGTAGCIVIACPVRVPPTATDMRFIDTWMETGGTVILLASPRRATEADLYVYFSLGVREAARSESPPRRWSAWQNWRQEQDTLHRRATAPFSPEMPITWMRTRESRIGAASAEQWFSNRRGDLAVAVRPKGAGRLVIVDNVTMFANNWIGNNGNAAFLEDLFAALDLRGTPIHFAEWLHGERDLNNAANPLGFPFAIMMLHFAALYLAAVWSMSRPFGPSMGAAREAGSDTRGWLLALAGLHAEREHIAEGSRALGRHALRVLPADDPLRPELSGATSSGEAFLERARRIAARLGGQRTRKPGRPRRAAGEEQGE